MDVKTPQDTLTLDPIAMNVVNRVAAGSQLSGDLSFEGGLLVQGEIAGNIRVNAAVAPDFAMPFGGMKLSGWGRENGREGVESFTELKSVAIDLNP